MTQLFLHRLPDIFKLIPGQWTRGLTKPNKRMPCCMRVQMIQSEASRSIV